MKNIYICDYKRATLNIVPVGHCIDADNGIFYVISEDFRLTKINESGKLEVGHVQFDFAKLGLGRLKKEDIILFEYVVENNSILLVHKLGYFFQIGSLSPHGWCKELYKHEKKVSSAKLSPNQDLIALADENDDLHVMAIDCTLLHTSNARNNNDSLHKPVGVGWGSKETQFFGLDGRPSKEKETKDKIELSDIEKRATERIESDESFREYREIYNKGTILDWRGDGQLLATLTYLSDVDKHYLKVWNRNLELQYMSEQLVTVEKGFLSWIPNGQYVCCAQRRENRINEIALFERNGLVHQRITLPTKIPDLYIQDMLWSSDSKILALIVRRYQLINHRIQYRPMLMLYTMQNFHYYLKHTSYLESEEHSIRWDPINLNRLHIISGNGAYVAFDCRFCVTHSDEYSTVYVVDADRLLITPFQLCNVPPPMSAIEIKLENLISKVAVCPSRADIICVVTMENEIFFHSPTQNIDEKARFLINLNIPTAEPLYSRLSLHLIIIDELGDIQLLTNTSDEYVAIGTRCSVESSELVGIQHQDPFIKIISSFPGRVVTSLPRDICSKQKSLNIIFNDGCVELLDFDSGDARQSFSLNPVENCKSEFNIIESQIIKSASSENHVVTLSQDSSLRFDSMVLASNCCTSFRITDNYLIYTTSDNTIQFLLLDHLLTSDKLKFNTDPLTQPIENGGTLVIASEQDFKIVLQMPRGNLETLHPRVLVFTRLTTLLDASLYVDAIKLARRNRINLNFLADYLLRLSDTLNEVNKFANTIADFDPTLLNLFITELNDDDSISDRYQSITKQLPERMVDFAKPAPLEVSEKVNRICSAIILPEDFKYLQPRILCLLNSKPKKTCEVLKTIYTLPEELKNSMLKFVLYFINIDQLFLDAIRTYDTDIALMVASASNKDPKEYLALLDRFNSKSDINLRRSAMDDYTKNYESSFDNLFEYLMRQTSEEEDRQEYERAIVEFVDNHREFKHATSQITRRDTSANLKESIWSKYADYLLTKRFHTEAGLAYSKALDISGQKVHFDNALKCFSLAENWEMSVALIERSKMEPNIKDGCIKKISDHLAERGKFVEAMAVLIRHRDDATNEKGFQMIARGHWFLGEFYLSGDSKEKGRSVLAQAVLEASSEEYNKLSSKLKAMEGYFARLKDLLTNYQHNKTYNLDPDNCYLADSLSTVDGSEISSLASGTENDQKKARSGAPSLKTRVSSKSNKSQGPRMKRVNLKVGSRHEDIGIVLEIQGFLRKQREVQETFVEISAALFEYCDLDIARSEIRKSSDLLSRTLRFSQDVIESLWPASSMVDQKYSLYQRFSSVILSSSDEPIENVDLDILKRPEISGNLITLEL